MYRTARLILPTLGLVFCSPDWAHDRYVEELKTKMEEERTRMEAQMRKLEIDLRNERRVSHRD